jgi:hypothetical protein
VQVVQEAVHGADGLGMLLADAPGFFAADFVRTTKLKTSAAAV